MHVFILAARPSVNEQAKPICLNVSLATEAEVYLLGFNGRGFRIFSGHIESTNSLIPFAGLTFVFVAANVMNDISACYRNGKQHMYPIATYQ